MNIQHFWEEIELSDGKKLQNRYAYRMDGPHPDMRKFVGLGTCSCSDYFTTWKDDKILLIEDSQIGLKIKELKNDYKSLRREERKKRIRRDIQQEHQLKAYGTVLVLCRLISQSKAAKGILKGRRNHIFWIVANDTDSAGYAMFFNNARTRLIEVLRSTLSRQIVHDVHLLTFKQLKYKFPNP